MLPILLLTTALSSAPSDAPELLQELGSDRLRHAGRVVLLQHAAPGVPLVATTANGEVRFWNPDDGVLLEGFDLEGSHGWTLGMLQEGRLLIGLRDDHAVVWERGEEGYEQADPFELGLGDLVSLGGGLSVSPGGDRVAIWPLKGVGGGLMLADLNTGKRMPTNFEGFKAEDAAWSPDGSLVAVLLTNPFKVLGRAGTAEQDCSRVLVLRTADGSVVTTIHSEVEYLRDLEFGPMEGAENGLLAGAGEQGLQLWELPSGRVLTRFGNTGDTMHITRAQTDEGLLLAATGPDLLIEGWRLSMDEAPELVFEHHLERPLGDLELAPDGRHLVGAESTSALRWRLPDFELEPKAYGHSGALSALDAQGDRLISCSYDGAALIWDRATGSCVRLPRQHEGLVFDASLSPDGQRLVTCGQDGTLRLRSLAEENFGEELFVRTGQSAAGFTAASFSPDGSLIAGVTADGILWIWQAEDGLLLRSFEGLRGLDFSLAWSPDGGRIAVGSTGVKIWSTETWEVAGELADLGSPVMALCFEPTGTSLAVGLAGRAVQLRKVEDGSRVAVWADIPSRVQDLVWWPGHGLVATARGTGVALLLGREQGPVVQLQIPRGSDALVLAADGEGHLLTGDSLGFLQVWK
ncbi:MAG: hypothetical protein P1V81_14855 [Planctomycetota bacterium]|nr:hypothetical protein [Planctomycetota bacterium]